MTFLQQLLLYFCSVVCFLMLLSGGFNAARNFWRKQIDKRATEKISAGQQGAPLQ